jgi:hypothetical protein
MSGNRLRFIAAAAAAAASLAVTSAVVRAADPGAVRAADPGAAPATEPTTHELLEQIKQLQAKVEKLEAKQTATNFDVARTVDDIMKDAEKRSVLLDPIPFTGNWQAGKFTLRSDDGNFLLHPWFQLQFRNTTNYREDGGDGDSDFQNGFEVRRMKFGADGNVFSPNTTYLFNWATNRNGGNLQLEEAWLRHKLNDTWAIKGG